MRAELIAFAPIVALACASAENDRPDSGHPAPDAETPALPDSGASDSGARPGTIDPSFGSFGLASEYRGAVAGIVVAPDEKIFVAGTYYEGGRGIGVARYFPNGVVDISFGIEGIVNTTHDPFLTDNASAVQLLRRADGILIAVGRVIMPEFRGVGLVALDPQGSFDDSFGDRGRALPMIASATTADVVPVDAALVEGGSVVIAGLFSGNPSTAFVARVGPLGALEATTILDQRTRLRAIDAAPGGLIVAGGYDGEPRAAHHSLILRIGLDGELDPAFGDGGRAIFELAPDDEVADLVVQPDGKIVAAINAIEGAPRGLILRLLANGSLDPEFGEGGIVRVDGLPPIMFGPLGLAADGSIVAGGDIRVGGFTRPMMMRFGPNGAHDLRFGPDGLAIFERVEPPGYPSRIAFDAQGRILFGGATGDVTRFFVMRVMP